jgi:hypothetical protein
LHVSQQPPTPTHPAWLAGTWEGEALMVSAAKEQGVSVPPQLSHAVLFYTAGELTARELKSHGIDYTHYAHLGIYTNMCGASCEERMAVHWTPHLEGKRSIVESLSALVATFK